MAVLIYVVVAVVGAGSMGSAQSDKPNIDPRSIPTPVRTDPQVRTRMNPEFQRRAGESDTDYARRVAQAKRVNVQGVDMRDATRGKAIIVAGRKVQLPPDAYVEWLVGDVACAPGSADCPVPPLYTIRRQNSFVTVSVKTGKMGPMTIAADEEGILDFLKEALK